MPHELFGRFSSKSDFIRYFRDNCKCTTTTSLSCAVQLYLPPEYMMNKDFLKEVFKEDKQLLQLNEVNRVNVPLYDELAVTTFWPMMKDDEHFMRFFPSKLPKGRVPDREYFWNIMHTLQPDYVQQLVRHAQAQRNSSEVQARAIETIEISDKWWQQLNSVPFISRKCLYLLLIEFFCDICAQNTKARRSTCWSKAPSRSLRSANAARLISWELFRITRQLKPRRSETTRKKVRTING